MILNVINYIHQVLRNFPEGLQADICLHLNRKLLESNKAFTESSPGCLRSLSLKLVTTHCPPGDYIIHSGDEITHLYWIGRGTVEIMSTAKCPTADDTIIAVLGERMILKNEQFVIVKFEWERFIAFHFL